jgi:Zn finger protein HypA/HybF involved in hydrogenase expression
MSQVRHTSPRQLSLVPRSVNIATAITEGFFQCLACLCVETEYDPDALFRRCKRCGSPRIKFHPGIGR